MLTATAIDKVSLQVDHQHHVDSSAPYSADLSIPAHIAKLARELLTQTDAAEHAVFFLDSSCRLLAFAEFEPKESHASFVREALRIALLQGAESIVLCSVRVSQGIVPRNDDFALMRELYRSGTVLGLPLYDHVLVDADEYYSFREFGWLELPAFRL